MHSVANAKLKMFFILKLINFAPKLYFRKKAYSPNPCVLCKMLNAQ